MTGRSRPTPTGTLTDQQRESWQRSVDAARRFLGERPPIPCVSVSTDVIDRVAKRLEMLESLFGAHHGPHLG